MNETPIPWKGWSSLSDRRDAWLSDPFLARLYERIETSVANAKLNLNLAKYYFGRPRMKANKTRFIMFGLMRSGTTVLGDLLAKHPELTWLGEAYKPEAYFPVVYLNSLAGRQSTQCVGLKAFTFQLTNRNAFDGFGRSDIARGRRRLKRLQEDGWKFLHLRRANIFSQCISLLRATTSGVWHSWKNQNESKRKVFIDPRDFALFLDFMIKCRSYERDVFLPFDVLQLDYEAELADPAYHQCTADKVFKYLELNAAAVSTQMKRLSKESLDVGIENYVELVDVAENAGVWIRSAT